MNAGILILNWNGRGLLEESLPSVLKAARYAGIPVVVADNGSVDGSVELIHSRFPEVKTIRLGSNLGFGAGYNRALRFLDWDFVLLLNNDMVVEEDFARILLRATPDDSLFGTTSQILFQDTATRRQETGRTAGRFRRGLLEVVHVEIEGGEAVPVLWLGGGSSLIHRRRFEELGGFEELYSPFYVEDLDLAYRAWKRGWASHVVPESIVHHKHRASTARLGRRVIDTVIWRNRYLFVWLNIRDRGMLSRHLLWLPVRAARSAVRDRTELYGLAAALRLAPRVLSRRHRNRVSSQESDRRVLERFASNWQTR